MGFFDQYFFEDATARVLKEQHRQMRRDTIRNAKIMGTVLNKTAKTTGKLVGLAGKSSVKAAKFMGNNAKQISADFNDRKANVNTNANPHRGNDNSIKARFEQRQNH